MTPGPAAHEPEVADLPPPGAVRTVACLMLGGIGDTLVATPAIRALRLRYPRARLTVLVRAEGRDLLAGHPDVDEVLPFHSGSRLRKARFLLGLLLRRWDLWVDLHTPTFNTVTTNEAVFRRNALMMRTARTRFRVGFAHPALAAGLTHRVAVPPRTVLEAENIVATTLRLAGGWTGEGQPRKRLPPVTPEDARRAEALARAQGGGGRPRVGLFIGSRQPSDVWPFEELVWFCRLFARRLPGHDLLLLGGPAEREAADRLHAALAEGDAPPVVDLAGRAALRDTAGLLAGCTALVTTDSGPMHMGEALGLKLVTLFSSKNYPAIWAPLSDHVMLNRPVPCGPCLRSICDRDNLCLALIRAEDVMAALQGLLCKRAA